jgi:hypothetical protein
MPGHLGWMKETKTAYKILVRKSHCVMLRSEITLPLLLWQRHAPTAMLLIIKYLNKYVTFDRVK